MRILLVHNNFDVQGGAEVFYHDVGRVLEEHDHDVAYFSAAGTGESEQWGHFFPNVANYNEGGAVRKLLSFPSMVYSRKSQQSITKLIEEFKPDVVHAFATYVKLTPSVLAAAKSMGVPVVMSCNDYKHICPNYKLYHSGRICEECKGGKFYRAAVNRCCHGSATYSVASSLEAYFHGSIDVYKKNVDLFLFASEFMARKTEEFWGADSFRWGRLRNPFDFHKHDVGASVGSYGLYFGRLIDEKGVDRLLEAAAMARDVQIRVVGEGPETERLKRMVTENKLENVQMLGPMWGSDLSDVLGNCRFVVVPSIWHENFPYVIFQAFAAGKPVLGAERGGIPELVEEGTRGWVYDVDDIKVLSDKLKKISKLDDAEIQQMGENAKQYIVDNFGDETIHIELMSAYERVLA